MPENIQITEIPHKASKPDVNTEKQLKIAKRKVSLRLKRTSQEPLQSLTLNQAVPHKRNSSEREVPYQLHRWLAESMWEQPWHGIRSSGGHFPPSEPSMGRSETGSNAAVAGSDGGSPSLSELKGRPS